MLSKRSHKELKGRSCSCDELVTLVAERMNRRTPFACFRLPGEGRTVHEIGLQNEARAVATTTEELREWKKHLAGFLMAPFAVTIETPMLWIEEEQGKQGASVLQLAACDEAELESFPPVAPIPQALPDSYRVTFARFIEHLEEGMAEKLVLAHRAELPSIATAQVIGAFDKALTHYPNAFVSLCYTPQSGLWLCATPEMLLRGDGADWQTVALAGTMPRQADGEPSVWSEKNRREHHYVQRFIGELLEQEGIPYQALDVETTTTGRLQHLQARFALQLPEGYTPITLAERLHPTPAVCGTPQRVAQRLILEEESAARSYYAGFLGWYEPERRVDLFVQIRCLQLLPEQALRLYAGGGIVRGSSLESEWQEVLHKLSAIHSLIR
ncbi:isochorismate synthase [uncultured Porphyromonas sp.]|uniref:isochorismate synthase n=1 Tax=uncultured Porphyromonas sp. TaxID=159274 RepID=UPI0028048663|nr:isochorismate synthase [uncultured Porphyromonas sp.]